MEHLVQRRAETAVRALRPRHERNMVPTLALQESSTRAATSHTREAERTTPMDQGSAAGDREFLF